MAPVPLRGLCLLTASRLAATATVENCQAFVWQADSQAIIKSSSMMEV